MNIDPYASLASPGRYHLITPHHSLNTLALDVNYVALNVKAAAK